MTDVPSFDLLEEEPRDRFAVGVASLAVITTMVAAVLGLLFVRASNEADAAASEALRAALTASSSSLAASQRTDEGLAIFEQGREEHQHARAAAEDAAFGGGSPDARAEAARWRTLATRTDHALRRVSSGEEHTQLDISTAGLEGPERDAAFPSAFRQRSQQLAYAELARRDAANARSGEWEKRTASYAAILTLLAVALYMYGFALTPQGRPLRGLFASVATAFLLLALMFGPVRALSEPGAAPTGAAPAYARGIVGLLSAQDPADYAAAADELSQSIAERPDFADAYVRRSDARFRAGTPQNVSAASLTTPEALQGSLADLRMAAALGQSTHGTLTNQGFNMYLLGVRTKRPALLREGLKITREAVAAQPDDPLPRFNLGVALLASGRVDEAKDEYDRALRPLVVQQLWLRPDLTSGALTDLELAAEHAPIELADDVRDLKERIVGSAAAGKLVEPKSKVRLVGVGASVEPGAAKLTLTDYKRLGGKTLAVQWYHEEPGGLGWSNVQQLMTLQATPELNADFSAWEITSPYVSTTKRCLPSGRYRVEVYQHGRLVGAAATSYDGRDIRPIVDEDHAVVGCRPAAWRRAPAPSPLVRSYVRADGRAGMHIVRLDRTVDPDVSWSADASRRVIDTVLGKLRVAPHGRVRHRRAIQETTLGDSAYAHEYTYRGGFMFAAATSAADGSTVLASVFGPRSAFVAAKVDPEAILTSLMPTRAAADAP
jgi:tetratricopeptide (TPR) repeat protein